MTRFLIIGSDTCVKCSNIKEFMEKNKIVYEYKEQTQELIDKYKFASIPTLIVLDEQNEEIDRAVNKESSLIAKVNKYK
jgi:thioredoxin-related protein